MANDDVILAQLGEAAPRGLRPEKAQAALAMVPRLHPLGYVGVAAMVGIYEEIVFRGFLMTRLRRATGSWFVAVLASTALFTSLHAFDQTPGPNAGRRL